MNKQEHVNTESTDLYEKVMDAFSVWMHARQHREEEAITICAIIDLAVARTMAANALMLESVSGVSAEQILGVFHERSKELLDIVQQDETIQ